MSLESRVTMLENNLKTLTKIRAEVDDEAKDKTEDVKRESEARADDMDLQIAMVQVDTEFLMCLEELNEEGGE